MELSLIAGVAIEYLSEFLCFVNMYYCHAVHCCWPCRVSYRERGKSL